MLTMTPIVRSGVSLATKARKRVAAKAFRKEREAWGDVKGTKPARDPAYRKWIATLPCLICQTTKGVECAHFGERGLRQKASDFETGPLCAWDHRVGPLSHHKLGKLFWKHCRLDWRVIVKALREKYLEEHGL